MPHRMQYGGDSVLEGVYEVRLGTAVAGKVQISRQGLYYHVICRCEIAGDTVYRLAVTSGNRKEYLGVVVPEESGYILDKRIPVKRFGDGEPAFTLIPRHDSLPGTFVPLSPEEPFRYIEKLKDSFLARQGGKTGIIIP